ncbi:MAG: glycosyltransferase [Ilumatobacter sp.]
MNATTCWVVSPMLFDTESYLRVRQETIHACSERHEAMRFVVVDDSAGTDPELERLHALDDVEVLSAPFNLGHQRAIVHGLRELADRVHDADVIVTMDSDGEDQPADVPRLLAALDDGDVSLALARRTQRSESLLFRVMYTVFRVVFRALTGTTVRSGNFAVQRGDSLRATIGHPAFDLCYSSSLLALRRPTTMVPCARGARFAGQSRMNAQSLMAHGVRMLLPFAERIAVRAMVVSAVTGAALVALLVVLCFVQPAALVVVAAATASVFFTALFSFVSLFARFDQGRG